MKLGEGFTLNKPPLPEDIEQIPSLDRLPVDYIQFMKNANGGHGGVGEEHLIIFPAQEIAEINKAAAVERFAPGLLIFASNGGGQSYAFDLRHEKVSIVKFFDMDLGDEDPVWCANSFDELLNYLAELE